MKRTLFIFGASFVFLIVLTACQSRHKLETVHKVEVAPMHITIDVNVKVDRALDDFFGDIDEVAEDMQVTQQ
ncbi:MAG: hypothetical protein GY874_04780 [Desulfobacteraceae bacterium]|nr:hypothetical protein [Desulfobacteraceae bacterium]